VERLIYDGYAHIDAAYGGSDYTALTCAKKQADGSIVMYGRLWQKDALSVMGEILAEVTRLRCGLIRCEDNGDRGFLKKEINRLSGRGIWAKTYSESQNKKIKIETYLKQAWEKIRFLEGTDREYIDQILDYTEYAEHDDAPDSAATVCRYFFTGHWDGK
jgi:predicted phage terminase large subunit-like protein